jgi:hypothetical protein
VKSALSMSLTDNRIIVVNPADVVVYASESAEVAAAELAQPMMVIKAGRITVTMPEAVIHHIEI